MFQTYARVCLKQSPSPRFSSHQLMANVVSLYYTPPPLPPPVLFWIKYQPSYFILAYLIKNNIFLICYVFIYVYIFICIKEIIYLIPLLKEQNAAFTSDVEHAERMHITFPLEKAGQVISSLPFVAALKIQSRILMFGLSPPFS